MTFQQFVDALYEAGWRSSCDGQHTNIKKLWDELCQRGLNIPFPPGVSLPTPRIFRGEPMFDSIKCVCNLHPVTIIRLRYEPHLQQRWDNLQEEAEALNKKLEAFNRDSENPAIW